MHLYSAESRSISTVLSVLSNGCQSTEGRKYHTPPICSLKLARGLPSLSTLDHSRLMVNLWRVISRVGMILGPKGKVKGQGHTA